MTFVETYLELLRLVAFMGGWAVAMLSTLVVSKVL